MRDIKVHTCCCMRCVCAKFIFKAFLSHESVWQLPEGSDTQDMSYDGASLEWAAVICKCRGAALTDAGLQFSPVVDQLLEMIFCSRDEDTDLFHQACSFGECKKCGWSKHFGDFEVLDRAGVMITWDTYKLCFKGTEAERHKREEAGLKVLNVKLVFVRPLFLRTSYSFSRIF